MRWHKNRINLFAKRIKSNRQFIYQNLFTRKILQMFSFSLRIYISDYTLCIQKNIDLHSPQCTQRLCDAVEITVGIVSNMAGICVYRMGVQTKHTHTNMRERDRDRNKYGRTFCLCGICHLTVKCNGLLPLLLFVRCFSFVAQQLKRNRIYHNNLLARFMRAPRAFGGIR